MLDHRYVPFLSPCLLWWSSIINDKLLDDATESESDVPLDNITETVGEEDLEEGSDESEQDVKDNEDYQPKVSTDCQPPIATDQDVEDNVSTALPEEANRLDCRGPIATIQSDFTITARLTHSGHTQKMHDMAEVHACICGIPVSQEDIEGGQGWNVCSTGLQNSMSE